ncbi:hypothetical protein VINI7043_16308 [Vibrio nigripulchritudo ATCC 27043]|nr:hypothetical protein VINI7043_16308 [Vibrio nigripulchritudo ATCC 27043]
MKAWVGLGVTHETQYPANDSKADTGLKSILVKPLLENGMNA